MTKKTAVEGHFRAPGSASRRDADEKELLDSFERGERKSARGAKRERTRYSRYAKATFRKDR